MKQTKYPALFTPLKFGSLVSKNRIMAAPMGARSTSDGFMRPTAHKFYADIARGGVGIVCLGETLVDNATGNNHGSVHRMDDPKYVPEMRECTRGIHNFGALASIELIHPGRRADPKFTPGGKVYGPTGGMAHYGSGEHYTTEMDQEMIDRIVNKFGDAAEIAMIGGCDLVTIQGGHGWLLNQFLSPNTNKRTDQYGGCIENRARFLVEVAKNVREKCGPDFGIEFRLSGSDFMENGATMEDVVETAKMLEPYIDMITVSASTFDDKRASVRMFPCMFMERGCNRIPAIEIKKAVKIPVISVGGYGDLDQMEELVASGQVDGIGLARELLADPMFAEKARLGKEDDIMLCTRCNECMSMGFVPYVKYPLGEAYCAVNPKCKMVFNTFPDVKRMGNHKVLVVGAGPAGMEAALGAAECGHSVLLAEKTGSFGGMLRAAWYPDFKKDLKRFTEVLARRIERAPNIEVKLNFTVTPDFIRENDFDDVIIAIGAKPIRPDIPGIDSPKVVLATEIHERELGQNLVFIGGGMVGCEEGIFAAKYQGKNVTIVEITDKYGKGAPFIHWLGMTIEMEKLDNLNMMLESTVTEITDNGVRVKAANGSVTEIPADSVIVGVGMQSLTEQAWELYNASNNAVIVGDAQKPARMNEAVAAGYYAGFNIQRLDS